MGPLWPMGNIAGRQAGKWSWRLCVHLQEGGKTPFHHVLLPQSGKEECGCGKQRRSSRSGECRGETATLAAGLGCELRERVRGVVRLVYCSRCLPPGGLWMMKQVHYRSAQG